MNNFAKHPARLWIIVAAITLLNHDVCAEDFRIFPGAVATERKEPRSIAASLLPSHKKLYYTTNASFEEVCVFYRKLGSEINQEYAVRARPPKGLTNLRMNNTAAYRPNRTTNRRIKLAAPKIEMPGGHRLAPTANGSADPPIKYTVIALDGAPTVEKSNRWVSIQSPVFDKLTKKPEGWKPLDAREATLITLHLPLESTTPTERPNRPEPMGGDGAWAPDESAAGLAPEEIEVQGVSVESTLDLDPIEVGPTREAFGTMSGAVIIPYADIEARK